MNFFFIPCHVVILIFTVIPIFAGDTLGGEGNNA